MLCKGHMPRNRPSERLMERDFTCLAPSLSQQSKLLRTQVSVLQSGTILSPRVTQIEIFYIQRYHSNCHNWEKLLASREQRPRITLNILQCTGQSPTIRIIQPKTSLMLLGQNLFQITVKQKENEEVPKVCLTKQPTGKRQMWKTFHRKETQMENKTRKIWNLVSKQGTQIMVRHHFTLN